MSYETQQTDRFYNVAYNDLKGQKFLSKPFYYSPEKLIAWAYVNQEL